MQQPEPQSGLARGESPAGQADESDQALAARALAGNQPALAELVERYQTLVLRVCERMLGNRHDAEDVVQETFVRALKSLARWDSTRPFRPWLLAIAANRCRTALAARRTVAVDSQSLADQLPARSDGRQPLGQLAEEVALALADVRPEGRQAFELFHYEQLAYAEIAEVLDAPVGTVKTWIHRTRQQVARQLIRRGVVEDLAESQPTAAGAKHLAPAW